MHHDSKALLTIVYCARLSSEKGAPCSITTIIAPVDLTCLRIEWPVGDEVFYFFKAEHMHKPGTDDGACPCSTQRS